VLKNEISGERLHMWEEGRHIIRDFDDVLQLSTLGSEVMLVENNYLNNAKELNKLEKMKKAPYFERFNFVLKENSEQMKIYIGTYSLIDNELFNFYVYDWRAPICSLFYEYDLGDAYYEAPSKKMEGVIVLKRQYKILNGTLIDIYDTNSPIHDDILNSILASNTNNKLKVIVSSIQKEQNIAIRSFRKRVALIYGPAGSGKTSVGLHRLAYLLYNQRKTISSSDIVILSNNNIYSSYIANILPELDENEIPCMLFYDLLTTLLPEKIRIENYYSQYTEIERDPLSCRVEWIKIINSYEMLCFCIKYFEEYRYIIPDLKYKNYLVMSKETVGEKLDGRNYSSYKSKLNALIVIVENSFEDYFLMNKGTIIENI
jgi:DNA helicase-2/ATP-dependent DNA helicase PcrA